MCPLTQMIFDFLASRLIPQATRRAVDEARMDIFVFLVWWLYEVTEWCEDPFHHGRKKHVSLGLRCNPSKPAREDVVVILILLPWEVDRDTSGQSTASRPSLSPTPSQNVD